MPVIVALCACLIGAGTAAAQAPRSEAAAAVAAAAKAFEAGDFAAALAGFERAQALRPAPKLHYNIGLCHRELMLAARERGDAAAEAERAAAAVAAFNAYLQEVPTADDRLEVEELVRGLGGTPLTQPRLKPIPTPREDPPPLVGPSADPPPESEAKAFDPPLESEAKAFDPPPVPVAGAATQVSGPPTRPAEVPLPGGRVGASFGLMVEPQLRPSRLDGAVQGHLSARIGGFAGARRRAYLGLGILLGAAGQTSAEKLGLTTQLFFLEAEYNVPLGQRRRLELALGGVASAAREALRIREGEPPTCAARTSGKLASQRAGGGAGGRVGLLVLLGPRRNHEIGVRLTTLILGFGGGSAASDCSPRPFAAHEVPQARVLLYSETGYAFRF